MKLYICVLATALFTFPPSVLLADDPMSMSDAVSLMKQRKWSEAVAALEEITKDQPNNATAVFNLAVALKSGGERERATGVFLRAVFAYEERVGGGRVITFVEEVNFRAYFRGANRLFLNAVVLGPSR